MADSSSVWWKLGFLRRQKSQSQVVSEGPAEVGSGPGGGAEGGEPRPQLDARLEKIMDKSNSAKGRHVKVSHSGRYKEKKRVRTTLTEMAPPPKDGGPQGQTQTTDGADSAPSDTPQVRK